MKAELKISPDFTIKDIHKIRSYNYEMTKDMTIDELSEYYRAGAQRGLKRMAELKEEANAESKNEKECAINDLIIKIKSLPVEQIPKVYDFISRMCE